MYVHVPLLLTHVYFSPDSPLYACQEFNAIAEEEKEGVYSSQWLGANSFAAALPPPSSSMHRQPIYYCELSVAHCYYYHEL